MISSWKEPVPGWIDNFNGPIGMIIAGGKGVVRTSLCNPDAVPDYMAVDVAIKGMIVAAWAMGAPRSLRQVAQFAKDIGKSLIELSCSSRTSLYTFYDHTNEISTLMMFSST